MANHAIGVSMASTSSVAPPRENILPRLRKARSALRHCSTKLSSPELTMHAVPNHKVHCTMSRNPLPVMTPCCCNTGTNTAQHSVPLMNMVTHTRKPVIAPAATKMKSQEKVTVRPCHSLNPSAPSSHFCASASNAVLVNFPQCLLTSTSPSAQNLSSAASTPAMPSAWAARIPFSPCECSARNVSAAAMPLGKRSCSTLIICRFIGTAMVTPRMARKNTQPNVSPSGSGWPFRRMNAANAETSVPPVE